ncbi:MAG: thioredoxin family protein [Acidobacteriota bacterium]|nr:thioredoxin family protein [Acidobacteriota bacterium]
MAVGAILERQQDSELASAAVTGLAPIESAGAPSVTPPQNPGPSSTDRARLAAEKALSATRPRRQPTPTQPLETSARRVPSSHSWYQGATGFLQGFEEAERENKAVLLYFYTDWCPYCKKLDRDILSRAQVEATTKFFVKIKVNPDNSGGEELLKTRYGVRGYPSLFVHAAGSNRPTKIRTMTRKNGKWRTSSPADFSALLTRTAGERFVAG